MNRPLKFRCWDVEDKQWINEHDWYIDQNGIVNIIDQSYQVGTYDKEAVVTQFTGLLDCEGNEIWEGDILSLGDSLNHEIKFFNGEFCACIKLNDKIYHIGLRIFYVEAAHRLVAGNIFESPELLEGG